jgi:hypothetical protein
MASPANASQEEARVAALLAKWRAQAREAATDPKVEAALQKLLAERPDLRKRSSLKR